VVSVPVFSCDIMNCKCGGPSGLLWGWNGRKIVRVTQFCLNVILVQTDGQIFLTVHLSFDESDLAEYMVHLLKK